jgi:ribokinase
MILVERTSAQNEIVVCPNVTQKLTPTFLTSRCGGTLEGLLRPGDKYFIAQNEIPLDTTLAMLKIAYEAGLYTVFNTAPAPQPQEVSRIVPYLRYVSLLCPNETEAGLMTGLEVSDATSAVPAARKLQGLGVKDVVVTLGANGFLLVEGNSPPTHGPGISVKAVDTTGAGDCFVGSMVFFMSIGNTLLESCTKANVCASLSVQAKGTQSSYPYAKDLPDGMA